MASTVLELSESIQRAISIFIEVFARTNRPIKGGLRLSKIEATPVRVLTTESSYSQPRQIRKVSFYDHGLSRQDPIVELMMFRDSRLPKDEFEVGIGWVAVDARYHPYIEEWESDEAKLRELLEGKTTWPNTGIVNGIVHSPEHGKGVWYLGEWQALSGFEPSELYDQGERVGWDHPIFRP